MRPGKSPTPPQMTAVKRWTWAGWDARWDWRYQVGVSRHACTRPTLIRRYAKRIGYAALHRLMTEAEAAYREPEGIPAGIFMGRGVLVPSATALGTTTPSCDS